MQEPMPTVKAISPEEYLARVSAAIPPFFAEMDRLQAELDTTRVERDRACELWAETTRELLAARAVVKQSRWQLFKRLCKGK
jgi:hypothetical protein